MAKYVRGEDAADRTKLVVGQFGRFCKGCGSESRSLVSDQMFVAVHLLRGCTRIASCNITPSASVRPTTEAANAHGRTVVRMRFGSSVAPGTDRLLCPRIRNDWNRIGEYWACGWSKRMHPSSTRWVSWLYRAACCCFSGPLHLVALRPGTEQRGTVCLPYP